MMPGREGEPPRGTRLSIRQPLRPLLDGSLFGPLAIRRRVDVWITGEAERLRPLLIGDDEQDVGFVRTAGQRIFFRME